MKRILVNIVFPSIIAVILFFILGSLIPAQGALLKPISSSAAASDQKSTISYVAIGDSLTEGVGDQTKKGGFVPLLAESIKDRYNLASVETANYGVAGERSDQILKRMKKDEKLQKSLKTADIITFTFGGNDLMKVFQTNLFDLTVKTFNKPSKKYAARVADIFATVRSYNKTAPIYVLGIYNPFYLNFPELTDMQTIVNNWNKTTEATVKAEDNAYFIPINDLLYKGIGGEETVTGTAAEGTADSSSTDSTAFADSSEESDPQTDSSEQVLNIIKNNALYSGDSFHPNNLGYQLIANASRDVLVKTQDAWLAKGDKKK